MHTEANETYALRELWASDVGVDAGVVDTDVRVHPEIRNNCNVADAGVYDHGGDIYNSVRARC